MDKRADERVAILGELQAEIMVFQPMAIVEIGRGGAMVETRFPVQVDSLHDLRLTLGATSVVLKGRVAYSKISDVDQDVVTYRTGLEFVDAPERVTAVIARFLDEMKATRGGD